MAEQNDDNIDLYAILGVTKNATESDIKKAELEKAFVEAGSKAVLVDFYAVWCGPCKVIAPKLQKLADETPSMVVLKVDVDKAADIAEKYDIQAMPTFKVFKDGKEVDTVVGGNPSSVEALFNKYK